MISPTSYYHSPDELGLLDIPDPPRPTDAAEADQYLRELGWGPSPSMSEAAAKTIGAIDGYNWRATGWVPFAHLTNIAQAVARYLTDQDGTDLPARVLSEQPQLIERAEQLRARRSEEMDEVERALESQLTSTDELVGGVRGDDVRELIRDRRQLLSSRSYGISAACFETLLAVGTRAAVIREKLPEFDSTDESMEQIRGRGIASALSLVEPLEPVAYSWLCRWDDQLSQITSETLSPNQQLSELIERVEEDLDDWELLELFEQCELTRSLVGETPAEIAPRLRLQLGVRLMERRRDRDPSQPPDVWL